MSHNRLHRLGKAHQVHQLEEIIFHLIFPQDRQRIWSHSTATVQVSGHTFVAAELRSSTTPTLCGGTWKCQTAKKPNTTDQYSAVLWQVTKDKQVVKYHHHFIVCVQYAKTNDEVIFFFRLSLSVIKLIYSKKFTWSKKKKKIRRAVHYSQPSLCLLCFTGAIPVPALWHTNCPALPDQPFSTDPNMNQREGKKARFS